MADNNNDNNTKDNNINNLQDPDHGLVLVSEVFPDNLIVLPLENRPVFPGLAFPLNFGNTELVKRIEYAIENEEGFVGVSLIKENNEEDITQSELYSTGTLLKIFRKLNQTESSINVYAQAVTRFHHVRDRLKTDIPHWHVKYEYEDQAQGKDDIKAFTMAVINSVKELIKYNPMFQEQMRLALTQVGLEKPGLLMDLVASFLSADGKKLQTVLEAVNLFERSEKLLILLKEEIELSKLQQDIQKQIEDKVSQHQREFFLREQLKVIKKELGLEKDDKTTEI